MNREDIIRMAREAGYGEALSDLHAPALERFAALIAAAEREKVAAWMIQRSYATGHGDTVEDLLKELEWQVREAWKEPRQWVGLTRDEVLDIEETHPLAFYRAIEAKLKEKNT